MSDDSMNSSYNLNFVLMICGIAALGGLLFGYDTAVISGAISPITRFFDLTPAGVGWAVANVTIGCVIGGFISGPLAGAVGRKKALLTAALLFTISAVGAAVVSSFTLFIIYRMIGGVAVGLASSVSPMYMSEVSPKSIRGRALGMQSVAVVFGEVVIYTINYLIAQGASQEWLDSTGWRIMIGSEAVPCVLFCVMSLIVPESPRWLVMVGREKEAEKVLGKIFTPAYAPKVVEDIKASLVEIEQAKTAEKKQDLWHDYRFWLIAFLASMICFLQQMSGVNVLCYFAPVVLENVTGDSSMAMFMTIFIGVFQLIGIIAGTLLMDKWGRVKLLKLGSIGSAIGLLICSYFMYQAKGASGSEAMMLGYGTLAGMMLFMLVFGATWAVGAWVVVGEVFPNRMRSAGMSVSVGVMWLSAFLISQFYPMLTSNAYLMEKFNGAHSMWLFAAAMLGSYFFVVRFMPETSGVSLEKMERNVLAKMMKKDPSEVDVPSAADVVAPASTGR